MSEKNYMDRQEAAKCLGLSIHWMEQNRNHPELPGHRVGKKIFYRSSDVEAFKAKRERAGTSLETLEEMQEASRSRTAIDPREKLDALFGGTDAKRSFVKPPAPSEEDFSGATKLHVLEKAGTATSAMRLHDVSQLADIEQSGIYILGPGMTIAYSATAARR